jgi:hypothetical protein
MTMPLVTAILTLFLPSIHSRAASPTTDTCPMPDEEELFFTNAALRNTNAYLNRETRWHPHLRHLKDFLDTYEQSVDKQTHGSAFLAACLRRKGREDNVHSCRKHSLFFKGKTDLHWSAEVLHQFDQVRAISAVCCICYANGYSIPQELQELFIEALVLPTNAQERSALVPLAIEGYRREKHPCF